MIKKIFLGALVIILAKCKTPTFTLNGPVAQLKTKIDGNCNSGQQTTLIGNAAINSVNSISNSGGMGSPIMTNAIAANTLTNAPIRVNTGFLVAANLGSGVINSQNFKNSFLDNIL